MKLKLCVLKVCASIVAIFASSQLVFAASIVHFDFDQLVTASQAAIEATVIDIQTVAVGFPRNAGSNNKISVSPEASPQTAPIDNTFEGDEAIDNSQETFDRPQSVDVVEGGYMLFTDVTLAVDREIFGNTADTLTIRTAGGTEGDVRVTVEGMPEFKLNQRYILFLRPGFDSAADPISGVNQGYFQVTTNRDTGEEMLLNANGDIVTSIQDNQVLVKRHPDKAVQSPVSLSPAPQRDSGAVTRAETSPEVLQYWESDEPPLSVDDFVLEAQAIRSIVQ